MSLFDLPSLLVVVLGLLFAALSGRFTRASLTVMDAVVLPVGLVGTLIGLVQMLQQMDDPTKIGPAISLALYTALYAAFAKICLQARLTSKASPAPEDPGARGWVAVILLLIMLGSAIAMGCPLFTFVDVDAVVTLLLAMAIIAGVTRSAGHPDLLVSLARFLPFVGLFTLYLSLVELLPGLDDPSTIGPTLAWGLLGLLYANVLTLVLHLVFPHRVATPSTTTQWLTFGTALAGVVLQMGLTVYAVG
jgi:hypothetical protein